MAKRILAIITVLAVAGFFGLMASFGTFANSSGIAPVNSAPPQYTVSQDLQVQQISIKATAAGTYDKTYITVKKGIPVILSFSADKDSGCGRALLMRDFGVNLLSRNGETVTATFLPQKEGTYEFSCSMRMFRGKLEVVP